MLVHNYYSTSDSKLGWRLREFKKYRPHNGKAHTPEWVRIAQIQVDAYTMIVARKLDVHTGQDRH